jgi:rhomboid protease GluP
MAGDEESSGTRDGELDVGAYSSSQLIELQRFIDRDAFPRNHAALTAEIERRNQEQTTEPTPSGRFTRHDGWRGWLEAVRRRSPVFGPGELHIIDDEVRLTGSHRTWLGNAAPREFAVPFAELRNAAVDGETLRFESRQSFWPRRTIEFQPAGERAARALLQRLPTSRSARFEERWRESREFSARLTALRGRQWISIALVLANVAVFVAMAIAARSWSPEPDPTRFIQWGSNYGPVTMGGQWWRLVSALFLHADWPHLLLNMWVLWNVGRLTERLYGSATFGFLYFASGVCGELARIVWEPAIQSIGASGAIFGIMGALLAMLFHPGSRIPRSVAFAYWPSMLAFTLFNLVSGFVNPLVDNAAHLGGLLSGFAFGWTCVRPVDASLRVAFAWRQTIGTVVLAIAIGGACFVHLHGVHGRTSVTERFMLDHPWYVSGEHANLQLWSELATRAQMGTISSTELVEKLNASIIPFWEDAQRRLAAEKPPASVEERTLLGMLRTFVEVRRAWAIALRELSSHPDAENAGKIAELARQATQVSARMQRLTLRSNFDQRARALASSSWVLRVKSWFSSGGKECVYEPGSTTEFSDAYNDGPKQRERAGCRAQRLFIDGDYSELESMISKSAQSLGDQADGGSSLAGAMDGIDDYIYYGHTDMPSLLGKTSDWRRTVKDSIAAELVESLVFRNWAWTARGHGTSDSVSLEAWEAFGARNEMALAGLEEIHERAMVNPYWYQLSLQNAGDREVDKTRMEEIFNEGVARFPDYLPIYTARMRELMPRWGGSVEELETFVGAAAESRRGKLDPDERYAQLYAAYSRMEDDEINVFAAGNADWPRIEAGFTKLRRRYPRSDLVLNQFAKFACMAGDGTVWRSLRAAVGNRKASLAWSEKRSLDGCDAMFKAQGAQN